MKVVLLAAGRSLRMQPIPDKNFLRFLGKSLIIHQLEAIVNAGFRDILIIGGKHNLAGLRRLLKENPLKAKVAVREQKDLELGMAGALLSAASWIKNDPFLLVSSNDVLAPEAFELVKKKIKLNEGFLLAKKVKSYFPGGYLKLSGGEIRKIVEKPAKGKEPSKLVNIVVHYHPQPKDLLAALHTVIVGAAKQSGAKAPSRAGGEGSNRSLRLRTRDDIYECALQILFDKKIPYRAIPYAGFWQPLKYPWHVLALMNHFLQIPNPKSQIPRSAIARSAKISGQVYFDNGVRVFDNAVIIGPAYIGKNTVIGTNSLVRESHIGANCVIGFGTEVARSFLGDSVWTHTNYIGDSIIGKDVAFGAGSVTGNFRLDEKEISVTISKKWNGKETQERVATGLTKLGLITGNHIRVGINTSFMPGVKIGSQSFIGAGITVNQDVPEGSFVRGEWKLKISENREKINPRP